MDSLKNIANTTFLIVLFLVSLLLTGPVLASQLTQKQQPPVVKQKKKSVAPGLADIIPQAAVLSGRFAELESQLKEVPDVAAIEKKYAGVMADLKQGATQLQQQKSLTAPSVVKISLLKQLIQEKKGFIKDTDRPLKGEIRRLDRWQTEWLAEKTRWGNWQSSLLKEQAPAQLKLTFLKANDTIDTALNLILQQLDTMLVVQTRGSIVMEGLNALGADLEDLIEVTKKDYQISQSPPMISSSYISQFKGEIWVAARSGLRLIPWPDYRSFVQNGWVLLLQALYFLVVISAIYRNRKSLNDSKRWKFLSTRPVSVSLFIVSLSSGLFLAYSQGLGTWKLVYVIVGGITCVRLLGRVVEQHWRKQAIYGVMTVFIVTTILLTINFPLPLHRLYIFLVSILALYFFIRWLRECASLPETGFYLWLLRAGCGFAVVIILAEVFGEEHVSAYLFQSVIQSTALTFPYLLLMYMINGGLHWLFFSSPVWQVKLLRNDAEFFARKVGVIFLAAIVGFGFLPTTLVSLGLYSNMLVATTDLLSRGFSIGTLHVSVGVIIAFAAVFYLTLLIAKILPKVILDEVVTGHKMQRGVQNSISKLIRYCIVFIGFLLAFMILGFDFTKLTIIMGALGVGIGFGLQGIVNNFVSGLILLFERPLREGDTIEINQQSVRIKKIGLRATIVETFEQADVIIPNADLISNPVTNWTLLNRQVRLSVPVGVAYGSDVPLVVETILACGKAHEMVSKSPVPEVLFLSFGESSLDFELRVWVPDADTRMGVKSDLYLQIERAFREAGIEIPFPQMDLHLRSSDLGNKVISPEPEAKVEADDCTEGAQ